MMPNSWKKLFWISLLFAHTALAETSPQRKPTKLFQSWETMGSIKLMATCFGTAYAPYCNTTWYGKVVFVGEWRKQQGVLYRSLTLMSALYGSCQATYGSCYVRLMGGLWSIYEGQDGLEGLYQASHFAIRLSLGSELGLLLTDHMALFFTYLPHYCFLDNPHGRWSYYWALGIKLTPWKLGLNKLQ